MSYSLNRFRNLKQDAHNSSNKIKLGIEIASLVQAQRTPVESNFKKYDIYVLCVGMYVIQCEHTSTSKLNIRM